MLSINYEILDNAKDLRLEGTARVGEVDSFSPLRVKFATVDDVYMTFA